MFPVIRMNASSTSARIAWISDRRRTPLATPETADRVAITTEITISAILSTRSSGMPISPLSPRESIETPMPSVTATPKTVPMIAAMSMVWPQRPHTRSPSSDSSAERIDSGLPRR